jgi:hypothetical protein
VTNFSQNLLINHRLALLSLQQHELSSVVRFSDLTGLKCLKVAEMMEMIYAAHAIHQSVLNLPINIAAQDPQVAFNP